MTRPHVIPRERFLALARGRGGADAVAVLRAGQLSKRRLLLLAVRRAAEERTPRAARQAGLAETYDELERLRRRSRARWEAALLLPYVDLWAADCLRLMHAEGSEEPWLGGLAQLLDGKGHLVRLDAAGHRLTLRIDDRGPYREAHGDPMPGPLGEELLRRWEGALAEAWCVLAHRHPWYAEALSAGLSTLVPLRPRPDGTSVSSAVRRGYGAIGVSLPPDPERLALALVHEFLHVQLGALLDLVPLHGPDSGARYHAPWRPDPRPAGALLQGTYAHLGVSDFWRAESGPYAREQYAHWRERTLGAADTLLGSGELTCDGRVFVGELQRAIVGWREA
ncbi:HEXXH motif-containing putative peptide modification protein [Streptomyces sp. NPDC002659]|uniref:aKG-HExxH-type peptide beta-hydroxylase n=1 Tax=Streptomyces sp. NPDC002659 TaxID=3364656 RepID=UPI003695121D